MARLNRNESGSNLNQGAIAVTSVPKQVANVRSNRVSLSIRNNGTTTVYIGPVGVSSSTGYPLLPTEEWEMVDYLGVLYVVTDTTGDLRYFEVY